MAGSHQRDDDPSSVLEFTRKGVVEGQRTFHAGLGFEGSGSSACLSRRKKIHLESELFTVLHMLHVTHALPTPSASTVQSLPKLDEERESGIWDLGCRRNFAISSNRISPVSNTEAHVS